MGGRAGGGASGGMGSRSRAGATGPKLSVVKETEKAVQVEAEAYVEYVPSGMGGFTSSMIKDKTFNMKVWLPKSQIKDGKPSDWIKGKKEQDLVDDSWLNSKMWNGKVHSVSLKFKYK